MKLTAAPQERWPKPLEGRGDKNYPSVESLLHSADAQPRGVELITGFRAGPPVQPRELSADEAWAIAARGASDWFIVETVKAHGAETASNPQRLAALKRLMSMTDGRAARLRSRVLHGGGESVTLFNPLMTREESGAALEIIRSVSGDRHAFHWLMTRLNRKDLLAGLKEEHAAELRSLTSQQPPMVPGDFKGLFRFFESVCDARPAGKNRLQNTVTGEHLEKFLACVRAEEKAILCTTFEVEPDEVGRRILSELKDAVKRRVHVHLLVDQFGTLNTRAGRQMFRELLSSLTPEEARYFHLYTDRAHPIFGDYLTHQKLTCFVSQGIVTNGGQNFGENYQKNWIDQTTFTNGPLRIPIAERILEQLTSEGMSELEAREIRQWLEEPEDHGDGDRCWLIPHNGNGQDENIKAAFIAAIQTAETSIDIAVPFFGDADLVEALAAASRRKPPVKVRLFLPGGTPFGLMKLAGRAWYDELLAAGVEIIETKKMFHLKNLLIDGKLALWGSSNGDSRSLRFNVETDAAAYNPDGQGFPAVMKRDIFDALAACGEVVDRGYRFLGLLRRLAPVL